MGALSSEELRDRLLTLASEIVASTNAAAKKSEDAAATEDVGDEEDPKFTEKVMTLRPAVMKKLNRFRKRKVKQLVDGISVNMTVEDLIDVLVALSAKT